MCKGLALESVKDEERERWVLKREDDDDVYRVKERESSAAVSKPRGPIIKSRESQVPSQ